VDAVAAHEEVAAGLRAVLEAGNRRALRRDLDVLQALAELDGDAPPDRLLAERLVEQAPLE
jgi:hypothetical protein